MSTGWFVSNLEAFERISNLLNNRQLAGQLIARLKIYEDDSHDTEPVRLIAQLLGEVRKWKGPDGSKAGWWYPTAPTYISAGGNLEAVLVGHTNAVHSVAYSKDGKLIASGSSDNTIRVILY